MKKTIRSLSIMALAGGMSLALAGAGYAQSQGGQPPAPGAQGHHWDPAQMRARMEEHRQRRAQMLHDAIGIRPDQDAAWQAFLAAMRPAGGERGEGRRDWKDRQDQAPLTTPQRLDRMTQRMAERQQRFQQRAAAIKAFYATLDPRQQKTFDALVGARFGRGGMGGHGMHGGGMGGWGHHGHMGPPGGPPGPPPPDGERG